MKELDSIIDSTLLYDFYGELLTEHQKKIYEEVVFEDYSISEIARVQGISRQGIYDLIKRCNKILESYEEKLGLVAKFKLTKSLVSRIKISCEEFEKTKDTNLIKNIEKLSDEIMNL